MIRIGIVHVYDPTTGLATLPVAAAGWDGTDVEVSWLPTDPARQTRASVGTIDMDWVKSHLQPTASLWVERIGNGDPFTPLKEQVANAVRLLIRTGVGI